MFGHVNLLISIAYKQRYSQDKKRIKPLLFKRCGELGLLGVTAYVNYGGSGMDATAACIVHEELSQVAFPLS